MIHSARRIADGATLECDVCIVGAGAAGITLALELIDSGLDVVLLEAGGVRRAGRAQELYRGEVVDPGRHLPPDRDRWRQLGGTTAIWGGRCLPYDPIDLEARPWVPHSGWPLEPAELDPYYRRAHHYLQCGAYAYTAAEALRDGPPQMIPGFADHELLASTIERWSPPTHFGKVYRRRLAEARNVRVLVGAVGVEIDASPDGRRATLLHVATLRGRRFRVAPRALVLSGGGLEVTRLLLASTKVHPTGIGNHSDWLGRGYMCHVSGSIARVQFPPEADVVFGYEIDADGVYCRRRLTISAEAQRRHRLLNVHVLLDRPLLHDPDHGSGMLSLAFIAKTLMQPWQNVQPGSGKYALYWRHFVNVISGSPEVLMALPRWSRQRFLQDRRMPSLMLKSRSNTYHLYYHTEQVPSRESRVTLGSERDALGMPRLRIDFRVTDQDVDAIVRAHELIGRELESQGCGKLQFDDSDPHALVRRHSAVLGHHIGTTRMSASPEDGVVDPDCRVHGTTNLFVASSSVFPTSSQANPTLTIVAMAIRLADHLKAKAASLG